MDNRGRGGNGGFRRKRSRRSGGNSGNEPGEASSLQAATQEESQPRDFLHQFNQPATPSFPPPRPPRRAPPPSTSSHCNSNYHDFIKAGDTLPSPSAPEHFVQSYFPGAREVQPPRQGALQLMERNLAGGSQQSSSCQFDSAGIAREEPDTTLKLALGPSATDPPHNLPAMKTKRSTESKGGCHEEEAPSATNNITIREQQPSRRVRQRLRKSNHEGIELDAHSSLGSKRKSNKPE